MTVLRQDCLPTPRLELDKDQACARSPFRLETKMQKQKNEAQNENKTKNTV